MGGGGSVGDFGVGHHFRLAGGESGRYVRLVVLVHSIWELILFLSQKRLVGSGGFEEARRVAATVRQQTKGRPRAVERRSIALCAPAVSFFRTMSPREMRRDGAQVV